MHKLIFRQLKRHRGIQSEQDVPPDWMPFVKAVSEAYDQADRDLALMERSLEISSAELTERNATLSSALDELKNLQGQLVHSAKMAGLGELVAGVSHEVNTPAGAILNAIEEVKASYKVLLPAMSSVIRELDVRMHDAFLSACGVASSVPREASTVEVRALAKELEEELGHLELPNARTLYRNLAGIGFHRGNVALLKDLLATPQAADVRRALVEIGSSQVHVRNIQIAIGRIIQLVKALKLYTHAEREALSKSDIAEDISTTLVILHNKFKRGIDVQKEFDVVPRVNCYADQLNQVWTNLLSNAADAMDGKGKIIIRLKLLSGHSIGVEIEDNGPGIDASIREKIFTPYVTTKAKGEGTGLGLSISKDIVTKHKGSIDVQSKPGCTVFKVVLPIDLTEIGAAS